MLMEMNSRPAQIYGMPMGVHGFSLHGNMGLLADDANQTQLNAIVDLRRKILALKPYLTDKSDRDFVDARMNTIFSGRTYPLSSDVADSMLADLGPVYKIMLNLPHGAKPFTPVGVQPDQTQPGFFDAISSAFVPVQAESQQAQPGFFDSLAMGAKEAFSSFASSITPSAVTPRPSMAPEILPDKSPTTWILKQQPPAAVVSVPSGPPSGAVPFTPQGPNFLDTLASIFGGVAIAAPGVSQAGQMFRKPPRVLPQLQQPQQQQPSSDWPKVAVVGLAVAAVIAVSVVAFKPKK